MSRIAHKSCLVSRLCHDSTYPVPKSPWAGGGGWNFNSDDGHGQLFGLKGLENLELWACRDPSGVLGLQLSNTALLMMMHADDDHDGADADDDNLAATCVESHSCGGKA